MKIDKHTVLQAKDVEEKIAPIVKSLNELTDYHFRYDDDNIFEDVKKTTSLLVNKIDVANKTILEGQQLYDARDQVLIDHAVSAMMDAPKKIESLERSIKSCSENYKIKVDGLTHQRYSLDEINRILPSEEHNKKNNDYTSEIALLERDHTALKQFVADTPNYSLEIIKDTQFYKYFLEHEEHFRSIHKN